MPRTFNTELTINGLGMLLRIHTCPYLENTSVRTYEFHRDIICEIRACIVDGISDQQVRDYIHRGQLVVHLTKGG